MGSDREPLLPPNADPEVLLEAAANEAYEQAQGEQVIQSDDEDANDEDLIDLRQLRLANQSIHWLRRPSVIIVSIAIFLLAFGKSSGESSRQVIQYKLACNALSKLGDGVCDPKDTQVLISNFQIVTTITMGIMSSIAAAKIGQLSDQFGRKPFIIAISITYFMGSAFKFLVMYNYSTFQFGLMVSADIITSVFGGLLSLMAITNCYISDVVEVDKRIHSLGIGFACVFLGLSTGPIIGNIILKFLVGDKAGTSGMDTSLGIDESDFLPLKFELVVYIVLILYTILILPESRSKTARQKSRSLSVTSLTEETNPTWYQKLNILKSLKLLIIPRELKPRLSSSNLRKQRISVILLVACDCVLSSLSMPLVEVYILYGLYKFNWGPTDIGRLLAAACASKALTLIVLSPIISHKLLQNQLGYKVIKKQFDMIDFSIIFGGMGIDGILFVLLGLAQSDSVFLLCIVLTCLGSITSPTLNSAIVKFYPESKLGEVFGALALLKSLCQLVGPFTFLTFYKTSLAKWDRPELIFYLAAGIFFGISITQVVIKRVLNLNATSDTPLGSSGSVSSLSGYFTDRTPSASNDVTPDDNVKYSDLHRKTSFARNKK